MKTIIEIEDKSVKITTENEPEISLNGFKPVRTAQDNVNNSKYPDPPYVEIFAKYLKGDGKASHLCRGYICDYNCPIGEKYCTMFSKMRDEFQRGVVK